jgi:hypothetical protein
LKNVHDAIRLSCNYLNGVDDEIVEWREKDGQIFVPVSDEDVEFSYAYDLAVTYENAFAEYDKSFYSTVQKLKYEFAGIFWHLFSWMLP